MLLGPLDMFNIRGAIAATGQACGNADSQTTAQRQSA
jgi:hypothetical protein